MRTEDELLVAAAEKAQKVIDATQTPRGYVVYQNPGRGGGIISKAGFMRHVLRQMYVNERIKDRIADLIAGGL